MAAVGTTLACSRSAKVDPTSDGLPVRRGDGWTVASPDAVGLDMNRLNELTESIRSGRWGNLHGVAVVRDEQLVYEAYFAGEDEKLGRDLGATEFNIDSLHDVRSITKTITATLVGVAIDRGDLPSVDTPLYSLLPRYHRLLTGDKRDITLRHVLTMSAGLEWDEESTSYLDRHNDERLLSESDDPVEFVLSRPLVAPPGSVHTYSGGQTHLLAAILTTSTGLSIDAYAEAVLFRPLAIEQWEWMDSGNAMPSAFSGLRLNLRDLAKFGQLYLAGGRFNGEAILSRAWTEVATSPVITYEDSEAPAFVLSNGYGYQWWTNVYETEHGILQVATAIGNGEQRIIVIPELSLVVAMFAGTYNSSESAWTPEHILLEHILPAVVELP